MYARCMSQTTIRVQTTQRDALARVAAERNESLDAALRRLLWEHDCMESLARMDADPVGLAEYRAEAEALAEVDVDVTDA